MSDSQFPLLNDENEETVLYSTFRQKAAIGQPDSSGHDIRYNWSGSLTLAGAQWTFGSQKISVWLVNHNVDSGNIKHSTLETQTLRSWQSKVELLEVNKLYA